MFRLSSKHGVVLVVFSFLLLTAVACTYSFYVAKRLLELQLRIATIEADVRDVRSRYETGAEMRNRRLDILEGAVFGVTLPKIAGTPNEAWQRNRDDEVRARLKALEEWRISRER